MSQKIVVGPIDKGIRTDRTAFVIDNDSFPILQNAYQWRGRIKRKRGTSALGRLNRYLGTTDGSGNLTVTIVPNTITSGISRFVVGSNVFTDPGGASPVVLITNGPGTATLNRSTGVLAISSSNAATAVYYYPGLPVLGLEDVSLNATMFPGCIAFDTTYSYNINTASPYNIYDVSFYKNPAATPPYNYTSYVAKGTWTKTTWNSQTYQQYWSLNYQGALWVTNGITAPFTVTNIGMQYKVITTVDNITGGPPATADLGITAHGLVVGDFLFINEVVTTTGINLQTGYVVAVVNANKVTVEFPNATIATNGTGGIAQYLTNRSDTTKDCIRWYDGDPTAGSPPTPTSSLGWVNFAPPLSQGSFSIDDNPAAQYYLVGAVMIVPYKDRLLFIGPVIQTSTANSQIYLQDTVIYSEVGSPYYTASFSGSPTSATTVFHSILTPYAGNATSDTETADPASYFCDQSGFGGFISAGYAQPIVTSGFNLDVLILGFSNRQTQFVYTGNDIFPFQFYSVNTEFGSQSTFSGVTLDRGVLTIGNRGIVLSNQNSCQRMDLSIPDQIFQFNLQNNGPQRITAQRDFINEWIYFTYLNNQFTSSFPNQTLQYNYRDDSWAIFNESYTTYGILRKSTGNTWSTIGNIFPTWAEWNEPWNAGSTTILQPSVIAGNQQGFVVTRDDGTGEADSIFIQQITNATSTITSPNHGLNNGDYIVISNCLGTISSLINGKIFKVSNVTTSTFVVKSLPNIVFSGTYLGSGTIKRMYIPRILTKQFPTSWGMSKKTRIGVQQYLFTVTPSGQVELQIYLSQNADSPYNFGPVVPEESLNNSLIYSDVLYTSPDVYIQNCNNVPMGNIGNSSSTTISINLQTLLKFQQPIVPGSVVITVGSLATFSDNGSGGFSVTGTGVSIGSSIVYTTGALVLVFSVAPAATASTITMNYYNGNIQSPTAAQQEQVWHRVNTSLIGDTVQIGFTLSDEQMFDEDFNSQFSEIELHAIILEVSPSSVLA